MLESLDDGVGRILSRLDELGISDNTIVIFTSDNGGVGLPELGPTPTTMEPLRAWKGHVYEGGIRVPLIVRWPGKVQGGSSTENVVIGTDFLPTFMEILGAKAASNDGKSFLPTLMNPTVHQERGPIFWHYPHFSNQEGRPAAAVRSGDYKLVQRYETGEVQLFNLRDDIAEQNDLGNRMTGKRNELKTLLEVWRRSVGANMPVPNPAVHIKVEK
jgi:arylsulfatase A-like enzyme